MLLSEWRKTAPNRECMSNRVLSVLRPVLADLGVGGDPACWVIWGEDPEFRYSIMAPTPAGLATIAIRLNGGGEDPRANGKLVRWAKLQVSELSVEAYGGNRIVAVQVEGQVLKGMDEEAGRICEFVRELLAGIDGRAGQIVLSGMQRAVALPKAAPAARATARKSEPKGPGAKLPPASAVPHPIPLPAARGLPAPSVTPAATPFAQPAAPAPTAHEPQEQLPTEPDSVWEIPQPTESPAEVKKGPRAWTP